MIFAPLFFHRVRWLPLGAMEFALTPRLRSAIERAMLRGGDSSVLAPSARGDARGISLEHVRLLSRLLREEEPRPPHVWVHELLEGAVPQLPAKPEKRAPHPELAPRMERLRAAQASREYAAMMGDVHGHNNDGLVDIEMASYKSQMGIGLNLVVSMGTMYIVGHYAGGTAEEPNGPRAVLFGLVLCIGTMLIEATLYIIGASRMEAKAQLRAEAAAKGHGSDMARVQKECATSSKRTGGGRWG